MTTSTSSIVKATAGSTNTSWIATINDSVIRADMTAAAASGTVSEAGMAQLFTDLTAKLAAANATLSASQLADLKIIAINLNVGETASSYLTYTVNALVNGNAANASWTGGAVSSTALGNLAVGTTATQLGELNGKWFLGTDTPSASVSMSGAATFTVTSTIVNAPLYGASGPSMNDINQGYLGDCYILSSVAELAHQNQAAVQSMITSNGNGTYGVRFFYNGSAEYVTVNAALANGGTEFNSGSVLWASLIEKAYTQAEAINNLTGNSVNAGNSYTTIGNGGWPDSALEAITGASMITDFNANGSSWAQYVYNSALLQTASASKLATASVLSTIAADLAAGDDVILSSNTNATDSAGRTTLVAAHAMSVYGFDSVTNMLEIRNPWGSASGQYWDTTFEVSLATLLAAGDSITVDNMGTSPTITPAPTPSAAVVTGALVSAAASLQASSAVTSFTIADTTANVAAGLSALGADSKLTAVALTDATTQTITLNSSQYAADTAVLAKITSNYNLAITGASAANAAALQSNSHVTGFTVADSAFNVITNILALVNESKLSSIVLTDSIKMTFGLTAAQYSAEASVFAKIATPYNLAISSATVAGASALQANAVVTSFSISDTAANVLAGVSALSSDSKLSSISLTNSTSPVFALNAAQYSADASVLSKISGNYSITVSGASAANAATLAANSHVTAFTLSDSSANVVSNITALNNDATLAAISLTDSNPLALTATQLSADAKLLAKLPSNYTLTVSGVAVSAAAAIQSNGHASAFGVVDSVANVSSGLSALNADSKLSLLTITGTSGGDTLNLTGSKLTTLINMAGSTASVSVGLTAASLTFISTPDAITLGSGASVINTTIQSTVGIETVANFAFGTDALMINMAGFANSLLHTANTMVGGKAAVAIYSSSNLHNGIVLTGTNANMTAASVLSHTSFSNGYAIIT